MVDKLREILLTQYIGSILVALNRLQRCNYADDVRRLRLYFVKYIIALDSVSCQVFEK